MTDAPQPPRLAVVKNDNGQADAARPPQRGIIVIDGHAQEWRFMGTHWFFSKSNSAELDVGIPDGFVHIYDMDKLLGSFLTPATLVYEDSVSELPVDDTEGDDFPDAGALAGVLGEALEAFGGTVTFTQESEGRFRITRAEDPPTPPANTTVIDDLWRRPV